MLDSLEVFRRTLWIVLGGGLGALALTFGGLIVSRFARSAAARRRARIEARYRPFVDALVVPARADAAIDALRAAPAKHHALIGSLLLRVLRVARGEIVQTLRTVADALGLERRWRDSLRDRRWWVRADSARALGQIRSAGAFDALAAALDDDHDEVRAAAVEALGLLEDVRAVPALLEGLAAGSRQQRVRVVEALRRFGPAATPRLVEQAARVPADRRTVAAVLGQIGGADAVPVLITWMSDEDAQVRAAAVEAAGTLGIDDRAHYYVLRALQDDAPAVRAMAARALSRSPRAGTARYLEPQLDDAWDVAVQSAVALKRLGREGLEVLQRRAAGGDQAARLAGQMLWQAGPSNAPRTGRAS